VIQSFHFNFTRRKPEARRIRTTLTSILVGSANEVLPVSISPSTTADRRQWGTTTQSAGRSIKWAHVLAAALAVAAGMACGGALTYELSTSALQARLFSAYTRRLVYAPGQGASPSIAFPHSGPLDESRGYSRLPGWQQRLAADGFEVTRQVKMSTQLAQLISWGISPPYREAPASGLRIHAQRLETFLREALERAEVFQDHAQREWTPAWK
jgi:hypothetical protein